MEAPLARRRSRSAARTQHGGPDGNERITGSTAAVLFALLAAEGVTILFIRPLISEHVFIGMLLIPPVVLKIGSTGWRFLRYYTGRREYVEKGPPVWWMRLLAPLVVASTTVLFATGVALIALGPKRGIVLGLHKASFVVWLVTTGVHVLGYVWRVPGLTTADWSREGKRAVAGSFLRRTLLALTLVAGVVLALATVKYAAPWRHFQGGDG